jgi:ABC-type antimicrobial peptide transport system permease subunit
MIEVHAAASAVAASDISRAIAGVDPRLKVEVQPLAALVAESLAAERLSAWATAAFGALGVILAMMGVYGLHAYVVSRRTTELGIRLALGAPRGRVLWGIWKDGMRPVAIGSALGLWLAVLAAAVLRHSVAGLSAADAEVALIAAVTLASIAGAACYIPARAAARLDPARALRAD